MDMLLLFLVTLPTANVNVEINGKEVIAMFVEISSTALMIVALVLAMLLVTQTVPEVVM